jgi:hypothetical protein
MGNIVFETANERDEFLTEKYIESTVFFITSELY